MAPPGDFYQYPAPFELPDEVTTPDGSTFTGHRARVYWLLRLTKERGYQHPVGRHRAPAGTVPVFLFREPWSGGQSGGRRVRELREYGVEVEIDDFSPREGQGSSTTLYRLVEDPIANGRAGTLRESRVSTQTGKETEHRQARSAGTTNGTAAAARPLSSLRFSTAAGDGRDAVAEGWIRHDLTPGSTSPLAPGMGVLSRATYLEELKAAWEAGELQRLGMGRGSILLVDTPLERPPFDVIETAAEILIWGGATRVEEVD